MDDYTWRKRLEARRQRRKRERLFAVFLFASMFVSMIWYFLVYTKTPSYAMETAFEALQEDDIQTFERYVDLPTLTARAYDDLTLDLFKYDKQLSEHERSLFENFYVLIRPQMSQGAVDVIEYRLNNGEWILPGGILLGRQLGIDFDLLLERSLIRHTTIKGLGKVEKVGDKARAVLEVVEDYTNMPFRLELSLELVKDSSRTFGGGEIELFNHKWTIGSFNFNFDMSNWKVVGIENYRDYLDVVSPILKQELADYIDATEEIVNRYNGMFRYQQDVFAYMQQTKDGIMTEQQRENVAGYIEATIIPSVQARQNELDQVGVTNGAIYLSKLRQESTAITIRAWNEYIRGLREDSPAAFDTAESLLKQELAVDQRVEEIVHNSAVSRERPSIP